MTTDSLDIGADLLSLREVGPWLEENLTAAAVPDSVKLRTGMELALQEICVNIVKHAYGGPSDERIRLAITVHQQSVTVAVADHGAAYDPADRPEVDLDTPTIGGYGMFLVEKLCETVAYDRIDDENQWTLTFSRSS